MVDIFDKCYKFTRADETKAKGMYPYFTPIQEVKAYFSLYPDFWYFSFRFCRRRRSSED